MHGPPPSSENTVPFIPAPSAWYPCSRMTSEPLPPQARILWRTDPKTVLLPKIPWTLPWTRRLPWGRLTIRYTPISRKARVSPLIRAIWTSAALMRKNIWPLCPKNIRKKKSRRLWSRHALRLRIWFPCICPPGRRVIPWLPPVPSPSAPRQRLVPARR